MPQVACAESSKRSSAYCAAAAASDSPEACGAPPPDMPTRNTRDPMAATAAKRRERDLWPSRRSTDDPRCDDAGGHPADDKVVVLRSELAPACITVFAM